MKTVIVVDTQWIGHIPMYHATIIERLLSLNHRVISISPHPQKASSAVRSLKKNELARFASIKLETSETDKLSRAMGWWQQCLKPIETEVIASGWIPDLVFFPGIESNIISSKLDGATLDHIFPYRWSGLYLTPKYLRKSFFSFQYKKFFRKDRFFEAKNCVGVAVLDENIVEKLSPLVSPTEVLIMPDFTNTDNSPSGSPPFDLLQEIENKSRGRKIIGLLGEISKRKGLTTLVDVAIKAKSKNKDWFFVFAGPLNDKNNNSEQLKVMHDKINEAPDNCLFHLSRIESESHFNDVFSRCNIIFAAYEKFYHSSNLLTKAAYFKRPTIVSKGYCMEERISKYRTGLAIPEGDSESCFSAIEALLKEQDLLGNSMKPQYETYLSFHTVKKLDAFLEKMLGKIPCPIPKKCLEPIASLGLKEKKV